MAETVTFDGNDFNNIRGLTINSFDPHRPVQRSLNISEFAREDKSAVPSAFYKSRKIHLTGSLGRTSKSDLQSGLQELESYLQTVEGLLVGNVAGISTQFTATKDNITTDYFAGGLADFDVEFFCSDPFGYAVSSTTLYNYAHLVGPAYSFAVKWSGNVKQTPVITITINSLLGGSGATITIGNPTSTESLVIQRTWETADILIINSKTKTITVNGDPVETTGKIPEWHNSEPITYADTISHRDIAVNIVYQVRNL